MTGLPSPGRNQAAKKKEQKEMEALFKEYFIFTKPHSIVTGDFYKAIEIKHYKIFNIIPK